jgi:CRP-like cAMP-binding protein
MDTASLATPVERLAQIELFAGLPPVYLHRIAQLGFEELHATESPVFSQGDLGDKLYLILDGAVRIFRSVGGTEETLAILRTGNYFGEMSLIDDAPRSADAKVHEDCRLFVIRKVDLSDLLFVDRDLAYELLWNFVHTLSARLREANDKLAMLSSASKF